MTDHRITTVNTHTDPRVRAVQVLAALDGARLDSTATHVHCGVQVDLYGSTQCGPVLSYAFIDNGKDFGYVEIRNYAGELVSKPLTDASLRDVRPCWDTACDPARTPDPGPDPDDEDEEEDSVPAVNPDSRGALREEADFGHDPYAGTGYDGD